MLKKFSLCTTHISRGWKKIELWRKKIPDIFRNKKITQILEPIKKQISLEVSVFIFDQEMVQSNTA